MEKEGNFIFLRMTSTCGGLIESELSWRGWIDCCQRTLQAGLRVTVDYVEDIIEFEQVPRKKLLLTQLSVPHLHSHAIGESFVIREVKAKRRIKHESLQRFNARDSHVAQAILEIPAGEIRDDQVLVMLCDLGIVMV